MLEGNLQELPYIKRNMSEDIENKINDLISYIGDDPNREGLLETPSRVMRSWQEIFGGYHISPEEILSQTFSAEGYEDIIICKNITFYSTCEHHMLPIIGQAHVGYLPKDRIVGLSKLPRLVHCYARRLQNQERLTNQIADSGFRILQPKGFGVVITAKHLCMSSRGVSLENSEMTTQSFKGEFTSPAKKNLFIESLERKAILS